MRRFLEFVVEHALSSPNEPLKEMIVGMELYAGQADFDPRTTAVVRVDATRLRTKLREYYSSEGANDALVIDLPKGSYSPVFREASISTPPRILLPTARSLNPLSLFSLSQILVPIPKPISATDSAKKSSTHCPPFGEFESWLAHPPLHLNTEMPMSGRLAGC